MTIVDSICRKENSWKAQNPVRQPSQPMPSPSESNP